MSPAQATPLRRTREAGDGRPIICPACGGTNEPTAVFCANRACGKALGEFSYVLEELELDTSRIAKLAQQVAELSGRPHSVTFHIVWFGLWVLANSGVLAAFSVFDAYPYGLLGIVLSIEGILITLFLLVSNNRQSAHAERRAALDYEVNVRTWRLVNHLADRLDDVVYRLGRLEEP
jgi:uncharacterized membrane protein